MSLLASQTYKEKERLFQNSSSFKTYNQLCRSQ